MNQPSQQQVREAITLLISYGVGDEEFWRSGKGVISDKSVQKQYQRVCLKYHPDKNTTHMDTSSIMASINAAWGLVKMYFSKGFVLSNTRELSVVEQREQHREKVRGFTKTIFESSDECIGNKRTKQLESKDKKYEQLLANAGIVSGQWERSKTIKRCRKKKGLRQKGLLLHGPLTKEETEMQNKRLEKRNKLKTQKLTKLLNSV